MRRLCAVLTCYNRRDLTLACLQRFFASDVEGIALSAVLVDDGSSDGTGQAVVERFGSRVQVVRGDGQLFWNGGMRVAMASAMAADPDMILWLNDDSMIRPHTVAALVRTHDERIHKGDATAIVVAAFADAATGQLSYSGMRRVGGALRPFAFQAVPPGDEPLRCDTMNGNCVLIPRAAWQRLQNLEAGFVHGLGDYDYGLRAKAVGIPLWVAPGFLGTCSRNSDRGTFKDPGLSLARRWRALTGKKGLPMAAWAIYTRRHGGVLWPLHWLSPYLKLVVAGLRSRHPAS